MEVVDTRQVLQLEQEQVLQQEVEVLQEQEQEEQHFHVLAVDDSVIDRKLLERLLRVRASSCKVTCVDSGDKALKYLGLNNNNNNPSAAAVTSLESPLQQDHQGIKVNMIMTDYCMPGMSGYDLLKRVKGSSWKDVPVVVMSSENVPSRINMCLEGGAEEFLLKPLQLSDLEKLQPYFLKTVLDNSSSSDDQESSSANSNNASTDDSDSTDDLNNSSITISKRKAAVSPDQPPERSRPKIKGLAVPVV